MGFIAVECPGEPNPEVGKHKSNFTIGFMVDILINYDILIPTSGMGF